MTEIIENPQPTAEAEPVRLDFHVAGVGASAGGLEALERLFERMPAKTGIAFVVIQHLSPDFKSLTDELLARRTSIPIFRVENGMQISPDAMYLIPPKKDMILSSGRLLLTDKDSAQLVALPIDHFFRSLAQDAGDRAIGIILSGTGSDGSRGVREIREAGGLVIAQTPESAKFDGMPKSAIETGAVELTAPPEQIPEILLRHVKHPLASPAPAPIPQQSVPPGLDAILRLLHRHYGIDFSHYKPDTVSRRIERRLLLNQEIPLEEYSRRLEDEPAELNQLYRDLLIGVTRFFRDEEAFARLEKDVLPSLLGRLGPDEEFRAWVAGCATGEEAYSLAMLILECLERLGRTIPVKVFATDVHRASLEIASAGIYKQASVADISPERLARFFVPRGEGYQVSPELRAAVVFAPHNVMKDAPFTKLDLITCRNLLIYFTAAVQKKVVSLFHFGLRSGGALFLGPSEGVGELSDEFDTIDPRWKIYRKRRDVRLATDVRPQLPQARTAPLQQGFGQPLGEGNVLGAAYDALLDEFMPPSLLVNERREVVQVFAGAGKYLGMRDGRWSNDVLDMVAPQMRVALSGALPRVWKEHAPVVYKGLHLELADGDKIVDLTVRPVRSRTGVTMTLVLLTEMEPASLPTPSAREVNFAQASKEQLVSLETELRSTRENLQATIEELETSNEELQATNEELVASNEELQSTNEELHSVNEELYTVNAEYHNKITQLTELTADMDNLLVNTEVHTIFLDRGLCIRKFTPKIAEVFNLLPQDVGRRIDSFTYSIDFPNLAETAQTVLTSGRPHEQEVRDRRGNWYLARVLPYRSGHSTDGVVFTLVEITAMKRAWAEVYEKESQLRGILSNSPSWVFVRNAAGKYLLAGDAFRRAVGVEPLGKTVHDIFPRDIAKLLDERDAKVLRTGEEEQVEVVIPLADGLHTFLSVAFALRDESGGMVGVGGIKTDITRLKEAEQQAREAVVQRDRFLAMLSHELRNPLAAIQSAAHMLQMQLGGADWVGVIERRSRHMSRLIDDLLDVSRVSQNMIELRKEVFDLAKTMPEAREEVQPWLAEGQLQLTEERPEGALLVEGDPHRLQQVQVNLLMNAAKYTPKGGRVWYRLAREGDEAVLRVRDTGVGLAPEMLQRVFEPFVQADETLARSAGGIGLGLTLVRRLVELHGGTVAAFSDGPGKGCEFVVRLPIAKQQRTTHEVQEIRGGPSRPSILVVEDDPDIRDSLARILEMDGFPVLVAGDGVAALSLVEQFRPDVMVIDIGLPGMDGYEVAREVRKRQFGTGPYLIALTGYGQPSDRQLAFDAGFDAHQTKPMCVAELMRQLAELDLRQSDAGKNENQ